MSQTSEDTASAAFPSAPPCPASSTASHQGALPYMYPASSSSTTDLHPPTTSSGKPINPASSENTAIAGIGTGPPAPVGAAGTGVSGGAGTPAPAATPFATPFGTPSATPSSAVSLKAKEKEKKERGAARHQLGMAQGTTLGGAHAHSTAYSVTGKRKKAKVTPSVAAVDVAVAAARAATATAGASTSQSPNAAGAPNAGTAVQPASTSTKGSGRASYETSPNETPPLAPRGSGDSRTDAQPQPPRQSPTADGGSNKASSQQRDHQGPGKSMPVAVHHQKIGSDNGTEGRSTTAATSAMTSPGSGAPSAPPAVATTHARGSLHSAPDAPENFAAAPGLMPSLAQRGSQVPLLSPTSSDLDGAAVAAAVSSVVVGSDGGTATVGAATARENDTAATKAAAKASAMISSLMEPDHALDHQPVGLFSRVDEGTPAAAGEASSAISAQQQPRPTALTASTASLHAGGVSAVAEDTPVGGRGGGGVAASAAKKTATFAAGSVPDLLGNSSSLLPLSVFEQDITCVSNNTTSAGKGAGAAGQSPSLPSPIMNAAATPSSSSAAHQQGRARSFSSSTNAVTTATNTCAPTENAARTGGKSDFREPVSTKTPTMENNEEVFVHPCAVVAMQCGLVAPQRVLAWAHSETATPLLGSSNDPTQPQSTQMKTGHGQVRASDGPTAALASNSQRTSRTTSPVMDSAPAFPLSKTPGSRAGAAAQAGSKTLRPSSLIGQVGDSSSVFPSGVMTPTDLGGAGGGSPFPLPTANAASATTSTAGAASGGQLSTIGQPQSGRASTSGAVGSAGLGGAGAKPPTGKRLPTAQAQAQAQARATFAAQAYGVGALPLSMRATTALPLDAVTGKKKEKKKERKEERKEEKRKKEGSSDATAGSLDDAGPAVSKQQLLRETQPSLPPDPQCQPVKEISSSSVAQTSNERLLCHAPPPPGTLTSTAAAPLEMTVPDAMWSSVDNAPWSAFEMLQLDPVRVRPRTSIDGSGNTNADRQPISAPRNVASCDVQNAEADRVRRLDETAVSPAVPSCQDSTVYISLAMANALKERQQSGASALPKASDHSKPEADQPLEKTIAQENQNTIREGTVGVIASEKRCVRLCNESAVIERSFATNNAAAVLRKLPAHRDLQEGSLGKHTRRDLPYDHSAPAAVVGNAAAFQSVKVTNAADVEKCGLLTPFAAAVSVAAHRETQRSSHHYSSSPVTDQGRNQEESSTFAAGRHGVADDDDGDNHGSQFQQLPFAKPQPSAPTEANKQLSQQRLLSARPTSPAPSPPPSQHELYAAACFAASVISFSHGNQAQRHGSVSAGSAHGASALPMSVMSPVTQHELGTGFGTTQNVEGGNAVENEGAASTGMVSPSLNVQTSTSPPSALLQQQVQKQQQVLNTAMCVVSTSASNPNPNPNPPSSSVNSGCGGDSCVPAQTHRSSHPALKISSPSAARGAHSVHLSSADERGLTSSAKATESSKRETPSDGDPKEVSPSSLLQRNVFNDPTAVGVTSAGAAPPLVQFSSPSSSSALQAKRRSVHASDGTPPPRVSPSDRPTGAGVHPIISTTTADLVHETGPQSQQRQQQQQPSQQQQQQQQHAAPPSSLVLPAFPMLPVAGTSSSQAAFPIASPLMPFSGGVAAFAGLHSGPNSLQGPPPLPESDSGRHLESGAVHATMKTDGHDSSHPHQGHGIAVASPAVGAAAAAVGRLSPMPAVRHGTSPLGPQSLDCAGPGSPLPAVTAGPLAALSHFLNTAHTTAFSTSATGAASVGGDASAGAASKAQAHVAAQMAALRHHRPSLPSTPDVPPPIASFLPDVSSPIPAPRLEALSVESTHRGLAAGDHDHDHDTTRAKSADPDNDMRENATSGRFVNDALVDTVVAAVECHDHSAERWAAQWVGGPKAGGSGGGNTNKKNNISTGGSAALDTSGILTRSGGVPFSEGAIAEQPDMPAAADISTLGGRCRAADDRLVFAAASGYAGPMPPLRPRPPTERDSIASATAGAGSIRGGDGGRIPGHRGKPGDSAAAPISSQHAATGALSLQGQLHPAGSEIQSVEDAVAEGLCAFQQAFASEGDSAGEKKTAAARSAGERGDDTTGSCHGTGAGAGGGQTARADAVALARLALSAGRHKDAVAALVTFGEIDAVWGLEERAIFFAAARHVIDDGLAQLADTTAAASAKISTAARALAARLSVQAQQSLSHDTFKHTTELSEPTVDADHDVGNGDDDDEGSPSSVLLKTNSSTAMRNDTVPIDVNTARFILHLGERSIAPELVAFTAYVVKFVIQTLVPAAVVPADFTHTATLSAMKWVLEACDDVAVAVRAFAAKREQIDAQCRTVILALRHEQSSAVRDGALANRKGDGVKKSMFLETEHSSSELVSAVHDRESPIGSSGDLVEELLAPISIALLPESYTSALFGAGVLSQSGTQSQPQSSGPAGDEHKEKDATKEAADVLGHSSSAQVAANNNASDSPTPAVPSMKKTSPPPSVTGAIQPSGGQGALFPPSYHDTIGRGLGARYTSTRRSGIASSGVAAVEHRERVVPHLAPSEIKSLEITGAGSLADLIKSNTVPDLVVRLLFGPHMSVSPHVAASAFSTGLFPATTRAVQIQAHTTNTPTIGREFMSVKEGGLRSPSEGSLRKSASSAMGNQLGTVGCVSSVLPTLSSANVLAVMHGVVTDCRTLLPPGHVLRLTAALTFALRIVRFVLTAAMAGGGMVAMDRTSTLLDLPPKVDTADDQSCASHPADLGHVAGGDGRRGHRDETAAMHAQSDFLRALWLGGTADCEGRASTEQLHSAASNAASIIAAVLYEAKCVDTANTASTSGSVFNTAASAAGAGCNASSLFAPFDATSMRLLSLDDDDLPSRVSTRQDASSQQTTPAHQSLHSTKQAPTIPKGDPSSDVAAAGGNRGKSAGVSPQTSPTDPSSANAAASTAKTTRDGGAAHSNAAAASCATKSNTARDDAHGKQSSGAVSAAGKSEGIGSTSSPSAGCAGGYPDARGVGFIRQARRLLRGFAANQSLKQSSTRPGDTSGSGSNPSKETKTTELPPPETAAKRGRRSPLSATDGSTGTPASASPVAASAPPVPGDQFSPMLSQQQQQQQQRDSQSSFSSKTAKGTVSIIAAVQNATGALSTMPSTAAAELIGTSRSLLLGRGRHRCAEENEPLPTTHVPRKPGTPVGVTVSCDDEQEHEDDTEGKRRQQGARGAPCHALSGARIAAVLDAIADGHDRRTPCHALDSPAAEALAALPPQVVHFCPSETLSEVLAQAAVIVDGAGSQGGGGGSGIRPPRDQGLTDGFGARKVLVHALMEVRGLLADLSGDE